MDTITRRVSTRSPVALARTALQVARAAIPAYSSKYSKKDFTQHQLLAVLALEQFFKTDDRGIVALLEDLSDLRQTLELKKLPHHTTLFHARPSWQRGLGGLLSSVFANAHRAGLIEKKPEAAIDSTDMDATVRSTHYACARRSKRYRMKKWPETGATVTHNATHLIAAAHVKASAPARTTACSRPALVQAAASIGHPDRLLADGGARFGGQPSRRPEALGVPLHRDQPQPP